MVEQKNLWRTRFCERCAYEHKQAEKKRRYHEQQDDCATWLLIYDPDGMDLWPKRPMFKLDEARRFPSGCQFRNTITNELLTIGKPNELSKNP